MDLLTYFGKDHLTKMPFHQLSSGHQRLVLFIRALIKRPIILLLDEPFQTLDKDIMHLAKRLIEDIIQPWQVLLFITHVPGEVPSTIDQTISL